MDIITVQELKSKQDNNEKFTLIDVREPEEVEICEINGSIKIPLGELEDHIDSLNPDSYYIIHCKMGGRSAQACQQLESHGFKHVSNLDGGILQWCDQIDPSLTQY